MKNKNLAVAIICSAIAVASCTKPVSELALYIPKEATAVFTIDTKAITDKIASSGITIDSLARLFENQHNESGTRWDDIKQSGIDLDKPVYIFSKQTSSIQQGNIESGALIAEVKNPKQVEAFFKKKSDHGNVLSGDKFQYVVLDNDNVAGWTDKILIVSTNKNNNDSNGVSTSSKQQLATLFSLKKSASISSLDEFTDLLAKPGDMHFYINTAAGLNTTAVTGMTNLNSLAENSYTEGVINFEKGRIVATTEMHYNKTLSGILSKYPSKSIDEDMIKNYPVTLASFGAISFDPKVLIDIIHQLGFDVVADGFSSSVGFTTNDVVNAFRGDIAIMFSPRSKIQEEHPASGESGFLLNLPIGDKTAFDKVMTGLLKKEILTKNGDEYKLGLAGGHGFVIETTGNSLFISSSDELIKAYQSPGNKTALPPDVEKEISGKTMAVYVDVNELLKSRTLKDSSNDGQAKVSKSAKETFKNFIVTADKGDGKTIKGNIELNFVNANENSLASLVKFIAVAQQEKLNQKNGWTAYPPLSGLQEYSFSDSKNALKQ